MLCLSGSTRNPSLGPNLSKLHAENAAGGRETRRKVVKWLNQVEGLVWYWRWTPFDGVMPWTLGDSSEGLLGWPSQEFPRAACTRHSMRLEGPLETRWSTRPKQLETLQTTNARAEGGRVSK